MNHVEIVHRPEGVTGRLMRAHATKGHEFLMDSGEGMVAASPVDTLLAALGACSSMDVIDILHKKRQTVTDYRVILDGERRAEHPRVFTKITVRHVVTGRGVSESAVRDAIRLSDEKYCTVHAMLAPTVELVSSWEVREG
ncbi:MAG TPA: OsmC family protein [Dongiaceae bacterium]|nr:OsmC family protein [Dongiaceae bacterium]